MTSAKIVYGGRLKDKVVGVLPDCQEEAINTKQIAERMGMATTGRRGDKTLSNLAAACRALQRDRSAQVVLSPPQNHGRRFLWYRI